MAFDALTVRCITNELRNIAVGARIDKISQPERDEIILSLRTHTDSFKLLLSASSANPRIHITGIQKKNPITAPMFCMLLRKHIGSGKITDISQTGFERIVKISIESYNELGDLTVKYLIIEIMGRHSNIILTNSQMKILDCIKHIDFTVSSVRQVLPGLEYVYPPTQDKIPLTEFTNDSFVDFSQAQSADKAILSSVAGIAPIVARELVYKTFKTTSVFANSLNTNQLASLKVNILTLAELANDGDFSPCIVRDASSGKFLDFSAFDIKQYGALADITGYDSMNSLADDFYSSRDMQERMKQKSTDLVRLLNNAIERAAKKKILLSRTLSDAGNREKYKIKGDLITANIYKIEQGAKSILADNYYDGTQLEITLDPTLSPSQNAQKYYKKYNKAKTAAREAQKQYDITLADLEYLQSTLAALENAENESDVNAIRRELAEQGYTAVKSGKKQRRNENSKPLHFKSSDGFDIYVGKNNTQNDYLTLKFANSADIWFHTKNIHGSHTVIKLGLDKNVPETTLCEAAELAAYYSKARTSSQVPVDYTTVKNVKKPNGAKPGMVIYDRYNTVYVTPKLIDKLD